MYYAYLPDANFGMFKFDISEIIIRSTFNYTNIDTTIWVSVSSKNQPKNLVEFHSVKIQLVTIELQFRTRLARHEDFPHFSHKYNPDYAKV